MNYFRFVAEEVREILASLGVRSLSEIIGRTEYLEVARRARPPGSASSISTPILSDAGSQRDAPQFCTTPRTRPSTRASSPSAWCATCCRRSRRKSGGEWRYELKQLQPLDRRAPLG